MWTPNLDRTDRAIYLAVADAIAEDVRTGRLAPGARLPAQRELADALGVDFTTITRAYAEARRHGLITSRVGKGTFVARPLSAVAPSAVLDGPVDMSMNQPPQITDAALLGRMWRAVSELERDQGSALLFRYQDPSGAAEDRAAGVEWLRGRLPDAAVETTLVSAGAQPALTAIIAELARPGDAICADALTYPGVRAAAAHLGTQLFGLEMDAEGVIPSALEQVCRDVGPKAFYCTPTLQNPTTATMSLERRREVVRISRRYGVTIIEDDPYGMLPADPAPAIAQLAPEITYHVAGLAKQVSPALRIAYVVAPDARAANRLAAGLRALTGMASPLTAALASQWIRTGLATAILDAIRQETVERRRIAADLLGVGAAQPAEAFHLWLPMPRSWSRAELQDQLARRRVSVVPSDAFALAGRPPEAVRIGLGGAATRDDLARALGSVADVLGSTPAWAATIV